MAAHLYLRHQHCFLLIMIHKGEKRDLLDFRGKATTQLLQKTSQQVDSVGPPISISSQTSPLLFSSPLHNLFFHFAVSLKNPVNSFIYAGALSHDCRASAAKVRNQPNTLCSFYRCIKRCTFAKTSTHCVQCVRHADRKIEPP